MAGESIHISLTVEKSGEFAQTIQAIHNTLTGEQVPCRPSGQFMTIEERCRIRWPFATLNQRQRIRHAFLKRYRQQVGRKPDKLTTAINAAFMIEEEYLPILDRVIETVRNEVEARELLPLFSRRR